MKKLNDGQWFTVKTEDDFNFLHKYGTLKRGKYLDGYRCKCGEWKGPGKYLSINYDEPCPRDCCVDNVHELIFQDEVAELIKEEIRDLCLMLKEAKKHI